MAQFHLEGVDINYEVRCAVLCHALPRCARGQYVWGGVTCFGLLGKAQEALLAVRSGAGECVSCRRAAPLVLSWQQTRPCRGGPGPAGMPPPAGLQRLQRPGHAVLCGRNGRSDQCKPELGGATHPPATHHLHSPAAALRPAAAPALCSCLTNQPLVCRPACRASRRATPTYTSPSHPTSPPGPLTGKGCLPAWRAALAMAGPQAGRGIGVSLSWPLVEVLGLECLLACYSVMHLLASPPTQAPDGGIRSPGANGSLAGW